MNRTLRIRGQRVTVTTNGRRTTYEFTIFGVSPEMGEAGVRLRKLDGQVYDVLVGPTPSCDCMGFLRWQTKCKHIELAKALVAKTGVNVSYG